ncbi:UPF0500 protein C1orf216 homolog isoform X2 [Salarias fasciatus]|uniref:Uncharacterized protein n=1 Tax=Salarias fasciatus TaxID=181472 RepID=A0A672HUS5_SALFA|nr:UPF0500 protein C1orf216 homolog isoform X2 [Salarias fasciatus]
MGESQSRSVMLHHQDHPVNSAYGGANDGSSSSSLRNRKDGNFNFLSGKDEEGFTGGRGGGGGGGGGGGDENRNQVRPRTLGPLGRDPPGSSPSSGFHHNAGVLSPRSRLPCWSPLEPLPEIESGDDGYGRVPPDGAEEGRMQEEEEGGRGVAFQDDGKRAEPPRRRSSLGFRGRPEDGELLEDDNEWGDSDSESEFSLRSGGSVSSLNLESGGELGMLMSGWDRVGVGEPRVNPGEAPRLANPEALARRSLGRKSLSGGVLGDVMEEGPEGLEEDREDRQDRSSDSDGELMDAVWTLRDRERFKAQEMEKHQVQLTMYRRLALIRWVRTLQGRVQEQQSRLQSSFDVILTHRKELLRMGAAAAVAAAAPPAAAAVGQS